MKGINLIKPGVKLGDLGFVIQNHAETNNYSVVREFCGHGLGEVFHDEPNILHYGVEDTGLSLQEGMFFTVEPMVNIGDYEVELSSDSWTVKTKDGSLSAHFEHTVAITKNGPKVLTS